MPPVLVAFFSAQVLLFLIFGLGALATAITMVLNPNPVRSALFLVLNLFCVAVLYLLLNAYFLAAVQIIVYAGAIMVLFLFVIMLLNLGAPDRAVDRLQWQQPVAVGAGLILAAMLAVTITASVPAVPVVRARTPQMAMAGVGTVAQGGGAARPAATAPGASGIPTGADPSLMTDPDTMGTTINVGRTLYDPVQPYLFPFEVTSVLLLIAVIGSVVLAKRRNPGEEMNP
ncbi:MAG: NADH-quinone oxidoreductase subunit J [Capsulimonadales bacterium]|nr:NADH-quinone oxidoreductase subunit J [Capsulimonadales bacterium]